MYVYNIYNTDYIRRFERSYLTVKVGWDILDVGREAGVSQLCGLNSQSR